MEVPMAMGRPKAVLVLDAEQRAQLESLATSRSPPAGLVRRAQIILLSASGKTNLEIAGQLKTRDSGEPTDSPVGIGVSGPISASEMASDALSVVRRLNSTGSAAKAA
jgi:hypothetical protein